MMRKIWEGDALSNPDAFKPDFTAPVCTSRAQAERIAKWGIATMQLALAAALIDRLEGVLKILEGDANDPSGACCDCLHDVESEGHAPGCGLEKALTAVKEWREGK